MCARGSCLDPEQADLTEDAVAGNVRAGLEPRRCSDCSVSGPERGDERERDMRSEIACVVAMAAFSVPAPAEVPAAAKAPLEEAIRGAKTDAERAARLLNGAKLVGDEPAVAVALLEQAVGYGLKGIRAPEAAKAASEALSLLEQKAPDRRGEWQAKRLEMAKLRYRYASAAEKAATGRLLLEAYLDAADTAEEGGRWKGAAEMYRRAYPIAHGLKLPRREMVAFKRLRAAHFDGVTRRIEAGRKALAANPSATSTRESLLLLLLAEMHDPEAAAELLADDVAVAWRTYVPLAAKDHGTLPPAGAAELGRWLHEFLAPKSSKYSRLGVLLSARDCYVRATRSTSAAKAGQMTLRMTLQRVDLAIEKIAMLPETAGWWGYAAMLRAVHLDRVSKAGIWNAERGGLTVWPRPEGYLRIPARITGDYRVSIRFSHRKLKGDLTRLADRFGLGDLARGNPGMGLVFPVGDRHLALSLEPEPGGATAKLFLIEPESPATPADTAAERTVTAKAPAMATDRAYQVDIAVFVDGETARVAAQLDRKPLLRWQGAVARCSVPKAWYLVVTKNTVLLQGNMGPTMFTSVKLCPFAGKLEIDP